MKRDVPNEATAPIGDGEMTRWVCTEQAPIVTRVPASAAVPIARDVNSSPEPPRRRAFRAFLQRMAGRIAKEAETNLARVIVKGMGYAALLLISAVIWAATGHSLSLTSIPRHVRRLHSSSSASISPAVTPTHFARYPPRQSNRLRSHTDRQTSVGREAIPGSPRIRMSVPLLWRRERLLRGARRRRPTGACRGRRPSEYAWRLKNPPRIP
jgi:hypothetical protein